MQQARSVLFPSQGSAALYHARRITTLMRSGVYQMEPAICFCGGERSQLVTEHDRYGIDYRLCLCLDCGLLYANPRMNAETMRNFYRDHYRLIYGESESPEDEFRNGLKHGQRFHEFLEHFDIHPRTIFDLGCGTGSWLMSFKDRGCRVLGTDWDGAMVREGLRHGIPMLEGDVFAALAEDQADLIILNHVLEHCADLDVILERVRATLKPGGFLYVGVPGLYPWDLDQLFQNAHCWQFTATTLTYVMECAGFEEWYSDEFICSLWRRMDEGPVRLRSQRPGELRDIQARLRGEGKRRIPMLIRTTNKTPVGERKANMRSALKRAIPDVGELCGSAASRPAIILGGGPSVDHHIYEVDALREQLDTVILATDRMLAWCRYHGLLPDYVVVLDAAEDVAPTLQDAPPEVSYIVATQCRPEVFEALQGHDVWCFNTPQKGLDVAEMWDAADRQRVTVVNAGGSVTLGAMSIAVLLGCRALHVFGFDCHLTAGNYAAHIAGNGDLRGVCEVECDARIWKTTAAYLSFAQQFHLWRQMAKRLGYVDTVRVYGDSLAVAMAVDAESLRGGGEKKDEA